MKSIIVGAGKVGYNITATLCRAGHQVTVIDCDRQRLDNLEEYFDINTVEGNAARISTLNEADVYHTDLLVAVTDKDELNMIACFIAKSAGAERTVARVRDPDYSDFHNVERMKSLGIDMMINPERVAALEISKMVNFPEAHYVGYYDEGKVLILELALPPDYPHSGKKLSELRFPAPCVIIGVERGDRFIIPRGDNALLAGDTVLLLSATQNMREIEHYLGVEHSQTKDIVIMGGGLCGYYVAKMLEKRGRRFNIRLIEQDLQRCEDMAEDLSLTTVIHGDSANLQLFEDEDIGSADAFIAASEDDRENLFSCVLAKSLGAKKTIAQIRNGDFVHIVEKAGIDKAISPRNLTADSILRFINSNKILTLTRFEDNSAQIIEFLIPKNAPACGKSLMELRFPQHAIICMILRSNAHIIPGGKDVVLPGDRLITFVMPEALREVERLFGT